MSRWDRRNDEGQYNQRQRNEVKHASNRPRLSRSRSRSASSDTRSHSRSRSRLPATDNPRHRAAPHMDDQRNRHRRHQQEEDERRRRQEALDSRGRAGPNGTRGPGPGGTPGMVGKRTSGSDHRASTGMPDGSKPKPPVAGIQMKLAAPASKEPPRLMKPVANAFRLADDSDDSEPEEMPAECRMRMRNIGRDTPTSSGPNSFGKTKHGFCDSKKMFEKKIGSSLGDR
ncbi:PEST proteolytic signal-containing nuclear protein-like [Anopheles marshallii]|uniref:PEST proteolytic signal-containing nuclear protein-like n=1 Tax=Anopheles marshallii TaxID=1521116 RepID=UPI00237C24A0|nr:PEST proteolytic signal-containing nuclear protein-like [Anopheles marshallii]